MLVLTFIFWLTLICLTSLYVGSELSKNLAYVWVALIVNAISLFVLDLDLLASAVLAIYSSVFLFLTLLSLVQTSYEAPASFKNLKTFKHILVFILLLVFIFNWISLPSDFSGFNGDSYFLLLWTDIIELTNEHVYTAAIALHFMFYKLFVAETILFNLYIFLGLIVAVLLLSCMRKPANNNKAAAAKNAKAQSLDIKAAPLNHVRAVTSFRRQTRRKNNSNTRFTL